MASAVKKLKISRDLIRHDDDCPGGEGCKCEDNEDCDDDEYCDEDEEECVPREDGADTLRYLMVGRYGPQLLKAPAADLARRAAVILGIARADMTDAGFLTAVTLRADAEWRADAEREYERDNDGKFASTGGGGGSGGSASTSDSEGAKGLPKISRKALEASQGKRLSAEDHDRAASLHGRAADTARKQGFSGLADAHARASAAHEDLAHIRGTVGQWAPDEASANRHGRQGKAAVDRAVAQVQEEREAVKARGPSGGASSTFTDRSDKDRRASAAIDSAQRATEQANRLNTPAAHREAAASHDNAMAESRSVGRMAQANLHTDYIDKHEAAARGLEGHTASSFGQKAAGRGSEATTASDHNNAAAAHREAARAHMAEGRQIGTSYGNADQRDSHFRAATKHDSAARAHEGAANGEGSPATARGRSEAAGHASQDAGGKPTHGIDTIKPRAATAPDRAKAEADYRAHRAAFAAKSPAEQAKAVREAKDARAATKAMIRGMSKEEVNRGASTSHPADAAFKGTGASTPHPADAMVKGKPTESHVATQSGTAQSTHADTHAANAAKHAENARSMASGTTPSARASARKAAESAALAKVAAEHGDHAAAAQHAANAERHANDAGKKAAEHRNASSGA